MQSTSGGSIQPHPKGYDRDVSQDEAIRRYGGPESSR
jgi:hypothetical protein